MVPIFLYKPRISTALSWKITNDSVKYSAVMLEYCWVPPSENACKVISADLHWNTEKRRDKEAINSFAARTLVHSSGKLGEYNMLRSQNPPALCTFFFNSVAVIFKFHQARLKITVTFF